MTGIGLIAAAMLAGTMGVAAAQTSTTTKTPSATTTTTTGKCWDAVTKQVRRDAEYHQRQQHHEREQHQLDCDRFELNEQFDEAAGGRWFARLQVIPRGLLIECPARRNPGGVFSGRIQGAGPLVGELPKQERQFENRRTLSDGTTREVSLPSPPA